MILTNDEDMAKKMNSAVFPGLQGGPLMHVIAAKAVAFTRRSSPSSRSMPTASSRMPRRWPRHAEGGRARHRLGRHRQPPDAGRPSPQGCQGQCREGARPRRITCNKNGIPFDPEKPAMVTSGIRLGTPAGTTRGFGPAEFREIGGMIAEVVDGLELHALPLLRPYR
jgi:glycine hydroxymethyltransferase